MANRYVIRHITRFDYDHPVSESVMEVRMRPASDERQRCLECSIETQPRARVFAYQDFLANWVHHFTLPHHHTQLTITARAHVEVDDPPVLPAAMQHASWGEVDAWANTGAYWDFRQPSRFATWSAGLDEFVASLGGLAHRVDDPVATVRGIMAAIHSRFEYAPNTTRVDSPIDEVLTARRGVCQDFTHVMIGAVRRIGLPARYVSGYIAPADTEHISGPTAIATHAWVDVCLPTLGWAGVDPTHNISVGPRHVRVATGRDYGDVPPTRGVFRGASASSLSVSVEVSPADVVATLTPAAAGSWATVVAETRQQQQQQQQ